MEKELSFSVSLHEEELEGKRVFVADCVELGISDFGDNIEEAIENLKDGTRLLLEEFPEKKAVLIKEKPVFFTKVYL